jgi:hypothetical protein
MVDYTKPSGLDKIWAATGVKTPAPDNSKISAGWVAEIPPKEYFNYLDNKQDAFIAHVNQRGGVTWDNTTEYLANISYAFGSNGILYRAVLNSGPPGTAVNPVGDVSGTWVVAYYLTTDVYTKTESNANYLTKISNLADLPNTATARNNLSVWSKAEADSKYVAITNNLSDVNAVTARTNLDVYSKSETDGKYLAISNNLSEVNAAAARGNLQLSSTTEANNLYLSKISNLSDLTSTATARTNLDVYSKSETDGKYLTYTGNLSGLSSPAVAFTNIKQYGDESTSGVLTISTDAAAANATENTTAISPKKLNLGFSVNFSPTAGHIKFPSWLRGFIIQWGSQVVGANTTLSPTKSIVFPTAALCVVCSPNSTGGGDLPSPHAYTVGTEVFLVNTDAGSTGINWFAIGY